MVINVKQKVKILPIIVFYLAKSFILCLLQFSILQVDVFKSIIASWMNSLYISSIVNFFGNQHEAKVLFVPQKNFFNYFF